MSPSLTNAPEKKKAKNFVLGQSQLESLRLRKEASGVDVSEQIRRALAAELSRLPANTREGLLLDINLEEETVFPASIPPSLWERVKARKAETKVPMERIVQIAVHRWLEGSEEVPADEPSDKPDETETLRQVMREELAAIAKARPGFSIVEIGEVPGRGVPVHQFDAMPCGPLEESEFEAIRLEIPPAIAQILRAKPGDWMVPARGESMVEAGIADGAAVLMRPYPKGKKPIPGDIVLVSVETTDGKRFSTIKFWYCDSRGEPVLRKGNLQLMPLPSNFKSMHPMAVFVGIIGPAANGSGTLKGRRSAQGGRPGARQTDQLENPESE
ncbi:MAG TPA: hypothetical protein VGB45_08680 [Abditibacterium sp.]|jgi:SOS-response transcriptional repressor LexA